MYQDLPGTWYQVFGTRYFVYIMYIFAFFLYNTQYHTLPVGQLSKLISSTTERVRTPSNVSMGSISTAVCPRTHLVRFVCALVGAEAKIG